MRFNSLKEKCNYYRNLTDYKISPNNNIMVMLDGRGFSKMIKKQFELPFDDDFIEMMNSTAQFLCKNVQGAKIAYVQSDEISILITDYDTPETDTVFAGRICKIQSILASMATSEFNRLFIKYHIRRCFGKGTFNAEAMTRLMDLIHMVQFDCKVWTVPNDNDAFAWFLYRQIDCIRNSKQQTAQTYLTHKELVGKNTDEQIAMCLDKRGVDWNLFSDDKKFGRFIYKKEETMYTDDNTEYKRDKFFCCPAFELSVPENKQRFFEIARINKSQETK